MKADVRKELGTPAFDWLMLSANGCLLVLFVLSVTAIEMVGGFTPHLTLWRLPDWSIRWAASIIFWFSVMAAPLSNAATISRSYRLKAGRGFFGRLRFYLVWGEAVGWSVSWIIFIAAFWPAIINGLGL